MRSPDPERDYHEEFPFGIECDDSSEMVPGHPIGSIRDGKVRFFVSPHMTDRAEGAASEGIAIDEAGDIITAEDALRVWRRYVKRS